jgi:hypothetical protein
LIWETLTPHFSFQEVQVVWFHFKNLINWLDNWFGVSNVKEISQREFRWPSYSVVVKFGKAFNKVVYKMCRIDIGIFTCCFGRPSIALSIYNGYWLISLNRGRIFKKTITVVDINLLNYIEKGVRCLWETVGALAMRKSNFNLASNLIHIVLIIGKKGNIAMPKVSHA